MTLHESPAHLVTGLVIFPVSGIFPLKSQAPLIITVFYTLLHRPDVCRRAWYQTSSLVFDFDVNATYGEISFG